MQCAYVFSHNLSLNTGSHKVMYLIFLCLSAPFSFENPFENQFTSQFKIRSDQKSNTFTSNLGVTSAGARLSAAIAGRIIAALKIWHNLPRDLPPDLCRIFCLVLNRSKLDFQQLCVCAYFQQSSCRKTCSVDPTIASMGALVIESPPERVEVLL